MVNYITLSIWIGGAIFVLAIVSFLWHYLKEKRQSKNNPFQAKQMGSPMMQPQSGVYPAQQMQFQQNIPTFPTNQGQYPQQQQPMQFAQQPQQPVQNTYKNPYFNNPYPEGSQEWYAFEMVKPKQPVQQPVLEPKPTPQEEMMARMMVKIGEMEKNNNKLEEKYRNALFQGLPEQPTIEPLIGLMPTNPVSQPKLEHNIMSGNIMKAIEIKNSNEIKAELKIKTIIPDLADSDTINHLRNTIDNAIKRNFKQMKKELQKDNIEADVEYDIL